MGLWFLFAGILLAHALKDVILTQWRRQCLGTIQGVQSRKKHTSTNENTACESVLHSGHADRLPCLLLFCIPLRQRILINWWTCPLPVFVSLWKLPPPPLFCIPLGVIREIDCVSLFPYLLPGSVRTFSQAKEKKMNELDSVFYKRRNGLSSFRFNDARQCNEL